MVRYVRKNIKETENAQETSPGETISADAKQEIVDAIAEILYRDFEKARWMYIVAEETEAPDGALTLTVGVQLHPRASRWNPSEFLEALKNNTYEFEDFTFLCSKENRHPGERGFFMDRGFDLVFRPITKILKKNKGKN